MTTRISTLYISAGLLLVATFAAAMLLTLSSGARIYRQIDAAAEAQYGERTALSYIAAKLRANDVVGGAELGSIGECQALILNRTVGGESYRTYIYCFDGSLRELLCPAEEQRGPAEGEAILSLDSLSFTFSDGLMTAECGLDGRSARISVFIRSEEAAA